MIPEHELTELVFNSMTERLDIQHEENVLFSDMREALINEGMIREFDPVVNVKNLQYGVIDGASINETTQGMDSILLTAATMHDGYFTVNKSPENKPFVLSATVRPYSKNNDKQNQAVMMMSELSVCSLIPGYDIRSMDGAYSTALITLLRTLSDARDYENIEYVIDFILGDNSEAVFKGIQGLLNPPEEDGKYIIGLAKAESTNDFIEAYRDILSLGKNHKIRGDKQFASRVLKPGEMFVPQTKKLGTMLKRSAGSLVSDIEDQRAPNEYKDLVHSLYSSIEKNSLDSRVFSTYFCPTENSRRGKVIRVDYSLPRPTTVLEEDVLLYHAEKVVKVVNKDVISPSYSEPYAQFKVDETCKRVVTGSLQKARGRLNSSKGMNSVTENMLYSYRT